MEIEFQKKWDEMIRLFNKRFQQDMDTQAILFLIGLQELGLKVEKLSKDQKLDVMHIAVCTLLEPYGFYEYEGRDRDDWPHWKSLQKLPRLNQKEQETLIKKSILEYFEERGVETV
jgi:hypothetical protein